MKKSPIFNIDINNIRNENNVQEIEYVKTIDMSENNSLKENTNDKVPLTNNNNEKVTENCILFEDDSEDNFYLINKPLYQNRKDNSHFSNDISLNNIMTDLPNSSGQDSQSKETINSSNYSLEKREDLFQQESNIIIPEKYKINDRLSGFLYPDDYNTFYFTKCRKLGEEKIINDLDNEETKFTKFNNSLGLYFCGKEIKIENEIKKCAPNEFICKECMKVNKKKYNIKNNYLINIKGRVSKINKGSYHCFGHFLCGSKGNQIEDCISKYSCKACKMLDLYSKYYL